MEIDHRPPGSALYPHLGCLHHSPRVDYFIANSHYTARRIWRAYRREADVIFPPVDIDRFVPSPQKDDYFIFVSRLVPYKQADLIVAAFTKMGLPLLVVGDGPQLDSANASPAGMSLSWVINLMPRSPN